MKKLTLLNLIIGLTLCEASAHAMDKAITQNSPSIITFCDYSNFVDLGAEPGSGSPETNSAQPTTEQQPFERMKFAQFNEKTQFPMEQQRRTQSAHYEANEHKNDN
ncbi:MAG: hypothetical protein NTX86_00645 [Candidatus Dependentiae bacterium]|nr:hypothetical protein [Candidatus Dependentiae bacterium]